MGDILGGFPAWSLSSRRQFLLGQLQFLFFSPFCMISQETSNLTNVPSPYNCLNCRPGSFTARKSISELEMKLALSISD